MFDLAIVNSWMEYKIDAKSQNIITKPMDLLDFRLNLDEYLVSGAKKRLSDDEEHVLTEDEENKPPAPMSCIDKRYDGFVGLQVMTSCSLLI